MPLVLLCAATLFASDWPQFLGPTRNGVYPGTDLAQSWPAAGPPVAWRKDVGEGFASPVVAGGKLVLFHRAGGKEIIECLDATTGAKVWSYDYPTTYRDDFGFDEGPRSAPAIAEGAVYAFGAEGVLTALDFATGKKRWSVATHTQFGVRKGLRGGRISTGGRRTGAGACRRCRCGDRGLRRQDRERCLESDQ